ncbi:MAG: hypothetical protein IIX77_01965 [Oscillospiraceae bacterium]|nr:hypothetical protein [Oscillospiraceae bacterium]
MRERSTFKIALCGVLGALSVALLMGSSLIPLFDYSLAGAAGLVLVPVLFEVSAKWAIMTYASAGLTALLLVPNKEPVFLYLFILGYFPILKYAVDFKIKNKLARLAIKLAVVNVGVLTSYFVMINIIGMPLLQDEFAAMGAVMLAVMVVLYNITAVVYDVALTKIWFLYHKVIGPKLKKAMGR